MAEEVFVIPRDAESVSASSVDDTSYVLVLRPGQRPVKVLVGDTGLKSKLSISDTAPLNAKSKDRWINSELKEFVFLNGGWSPVGGYLEPDPFYLTEVELAKEAANSAATLAAEKAILAQSAATLANIKATLADEKAALAQLAADNAAQAKVSNIISLEIRDDLCLWFETPETYSGITFELQNGNLIATV